MPCIKQHAFLFKGVCTSWKIWSTCPQTGVAKGWELGCFCFWLALWITANLPLAFPPDPPCCLMMFATCRCWRAPKATPLSGEQSSGHTPHTRWYPTAASWVHPQSEHPNSSSGCTAGEGLKRAEPQAPSCVHWLPALPGELGWASCAELSNSPQSARKGLCLLHWD